jgi:hypothetical protein
VEQNRGVASNAGYPSKADNPSEEGLEDCFFILFSANDTPRMTCQRHTGGKRNQFPLNKLWVPYENPWGAPTASKCVCTYMRAACTQQPWDSPKRLSTTTTKYPNAQSPQISGKGERNANVQLIQLFVYPPHHFDITLSKRTRRQEIETFGRANRRSEATDAEWAMSGVAHSVFA